MKLAAVFILGLTIGYLVRGALAVAYEKSRNRNQELP